MTITVRLAFWDAASRDLESQWYALTSLSDLAGVYVIWMTQDHLSPASGSLLVSSDDIPHVVGYPAAELAVAGAWERGLIT